MVALVSGSSLGLDLTSWRTLAGHATNGQAALGRAGDSAHVNVATGNLVLQQDDQWLMAQGPDARLLRTYNSQGLLDDDNGDNWRHGVGPQPLRLVGTWGEAGSSVLRREADGGVAVHAWDVPTGTYRSTDGDGAHDVIRRLASGELEWCDGSSGATLRYAGSGDLRLLESRDPAGPVLRFEYDTAGRLVRMQSASGDAMVWTWNGTDLAQVRTLLAGGQVAADTRYAYDAAHRLVSVTHDLTPADGTTADGARWTTQYGYVGESRLVNRVLQSDGSSLDITYVRAGGRDRVASVRDALGATLAFSYSLADAAAGFTTVTDPLGLVTRYDVDAQGRLAAITSPAVEGRVSTQTFAYDADGNLAAATDGEGRTTTWSYDGAGNQILQRDAAGRTVSRSFDAANQLASETRWLDLDPDGAGNAAPSDPVTTWYVRDPGSLRLRFVVDAEGHVTEHRYDAFGQRVTTLVYLAERLGAGAVPPTLASLQAWCAGQSAQRVQRTDEAYDARGQLAVRTTWARVDASGQGVADGKQAVERFVRDAAGRLLQRIGADGVATSWTYDALGRELTSTDGLGTTTLTQHDDARGTTRVTLANGLVTVRSWDAAGRLVALAETGPAGEQLGTTRYTYDAAGRLRLREDPVGVRHWTFWDDAGRLAAEVDGNGSCVRHVYDASGLLTETRRHATSVPPAQLADAQGRPLWTATAASIAPAPSVDDMRELRAYDAAGRLLRSAVRAGAGESYTVTQQTYDGAGRLVATTAFADPVSGAQVSAGAITPPPSSVRDRITRSFHDAQGRLIGQLDPEGALVTWSYDAAGACVERVAWATPTDPLRRASEGLAGLVPAASDQDQRTRWWHDAAGRVVAQLDAEGYLTETVRDGAGREALVVRYATAVTLAAGLVDVAQLRPAASARDRSTSRSWDAAGRLAAETVDGTTVRSTYDALGRLVATVRAADTDEARTVLARYDRQGRLVGELEGEGAARLTGTQTAAEVDAIWRQWGVRHTYDPAGRRLSTTSADGATQWFHYDADGALTHVVNALGEVQGWRYDALGRRVERLAWDLRAPTTGLTGGALPAALAATLSTGAITVERWVWSADGLLAETADAAGLVTTIRRDAFGQEVERARQVRPDRAVRTTMAYDLCGRLIASTDDADGLASRTLRRLDAFGRVVAVTEPGGAERQQSWDRLGRQVTVRDAAEGLRTTVYDAHGRVLVDTDALGRQTRYAWDPATRTLQLTTPEGITTSTTRNRHGDVVRIVDGSGAASTWRYDRQGRVVQSATPAGSTTQAYDTAGRLAETVDALGVRTTFGYDAAGRTLTRTVDPGGLGLVTRWSYDARGRQVTEVDARGVTTTRIYDDGGRLTLQVLDAGAGRLNLQTRFDWDAEGRQLSVTAPDGTTTLTSYDALGRRIAEVVDPTGLALARRWTWGPGGHLATSTDAQGGVTRYVNDAAGRPIFVVGPTGSVEQTTRDAAGRVVRTVRHASAIDPAALGERPTTADVQRLLRTLPSDVVEHRVLDADGRIVATVDGGGAVVRQVFDGAGRLVRRTVHANHIDPGAWQPGTLPQPVADPARDEDQRTVRDAAGRAIYTVDGAGALVAMTWDAAGQLLTRTAYAAALPPGTPTEPAALAAAAMRLAAPVSDAVERHGYDAAGRRIWSVGGTGAVTRRSFDEAGNLLRTVRLATAVAAGADPRVVATSAADQHEVQAWDAAGRLVFQVDPLGVATEFVSDGMGRVVRQVAYATPLTGAMSALPTTVAGLRSLLSTSASDRQSWQGWDAAGRLAVQVDATGAVISSAHDAVGRVVRRTAHALRLDLASLPATPTLDQLRALVVGQPGADRVSRQVWDAGGLLQLEVDPMGAATALRHDGVGRLVRSARLVTLLPGSGQATDAELLAAAAGSSEGPVETRTYTRTGRLGTVTDALGGIETTGWDAAGRRLWFTDAAGAKWTYVHDAAGRLVEECSPVVEIASATLGPDGRLVAEPTVQASIVTRQSWDALGRLIDRTEAADTPQARTTRYAYDAAGRQVRVVLPPVGVYEAAQDDLSRNGQGSLALRKETLRELETRTWYDTLGRVVAVRDTGGALSQKVLDLAGRVAYEVDPLGRITRLERNAFGEVVALTRYGQAVSTVVNPQLQSAGQVVTRAQVETALAGISHAADRVLRTRYDLAGRVIEVLEPVALVHDAGADPSAQLGQAGRTTRTTYDAFGQIVEVRQLRNPVTDSWSVTTRYWDLAGRERATVDALGHLTVRRHDAAGRVIESVESANALAAGSWSVAGHAAAASSADDRILRTDYDLLGRRVAQTRVQVEFSEAPDGSSRRGDLVARWTYDALGHVVASTDAAGATTWQAYDALGRLRATAAPARVLDTGSQLLSPVTSFLRNAHGQVVARIEHATARAGSGPGPIVQPAPSSSDRTELHAWDSHGRLQASTDAAGISVHRSYDAWGHQAKQWQQVKTLGGALRTAFQQDTHDAAGQLVRSVSPSPDALNSTSFQPLTTSSTYNVFGELTRKVVGTDPAESYEWDAAGRLWRTNSGDGVTRIQLYDAMGQLTAELRPTGIGGPASLATMTSAEQAASMPDLRRTEIVRDALGREVRRVLPARSEATAPVEAGALQVSTRVLARAAGAWGGDGWTWSGANDVEVKISRLAELGQGDVRVELGYRGLERQFVWAGYDLGWQDAVVPGPVRTVSSGIQTSEQAAKGIRVRWSDPVGDVGGLSEILSLRVSKRDATGAWRVVHDSAAGAGATTLFVRAPDDPTSRAVLELQAGGAPGAAWLTVPLAGFGQAALFDAASLGTGSWNYRTSIVRADGSQSMTASGTLAIGPAALAAIQEPIVATGSSLTWRTPADCAQVLRWRPVGSTGPWQSLAVAEGDDGISRVETSALPVGDHHFELLWTPAWATQPTSHATGRFSVLAAQPARWVPQVNYPPITGLAVQTNFENVPGYTWSDGFETLYDVARVTRFTWPVVQSPVFYWRSVDRGTAWATAAVDRQFEVIPNEVGDYVPGFQRAILPPNSPQGVYEVIVRSTVGAGAQVTARVTVDAFVQHVLEITTPPYTPGYWAAPLPVRCTVSVSTPASSAAISGSGALRATLGGAAAAVSRRPDVFQRLDRWGNVLEISDPRFQGWVTRYRYNAADQLVLESGPDAAGGQSASSPTTRHHYDAAGRLVATRDARGHVSGQAWNAAGQLVEERHADGGVVRHLYDVFGQRARTYDAMGWASWSTYDRAGRQSSLVRQEAGGTYRTTMRWSYDELGRKLTQVNAAGETLRYAWDLRGNLTQTVQPLGQFVSTRWDAGGRKLEEVDANLARSTWTYDAVTGLLSKSTDLAGITTSYTYDAATRQLIRQTSGRGQDRNYAYDAAGQLIRIVDAPMGQTTTYAYDLAGRRVRERMVQNGVTYQDSHLAWDVQGRLRDVTDARARVQMDYDAAGNRTRIRTAVMYAGTAGDAGSWSDRHFKYDAMNRQVVVDAVNANGDLGAQGHALAYDRNGNRTADSWWGTKVQAIAGEWVHTPDGEPWYQRPTTYVRTPGLVTETYGYDGLGQMLTATRDGVLLDRRVYDQAGRLVRSGPDPLAQDLVAALNAGLPADQANGHEIRQYSYDANGRLLHLKVLASDGSPRSDTVWDPRLAGLLQLQRTPAGYDAAGNALGYVVVSHGGQTVQTGYTNTLVRHQGYQVGSVSTSSTHFLPGSTTHRYDANGYLVQTTDSAQPLNSREIVNDAEGRVLWTSQGGRVQRQLIANGELLGTYGVAVDPLNPASGPERTPNFVDRADFAFGYVPVSATNPGAVPGSYVVRTGDTLQGIARSAYGDARLWFRIAEANGLRGATDVKVGQTLTIPLASGAVGNDTATFRPYDPARILGDLSPTLQEPLPPPSSKGCGGMGKVLMVAVSIALVASIGQPVGAFWNQLLTSSKVAAAIGTGATLGAAGAAAAQVTGMVTGDVRRFDWRGVALGAVGGSFAEVLSAGALGSSLAGQTQAATIGRVAVTALASQAVGVVTGLQPRFSWRGVAASVVGAAAGWEIGEALGLTIDGQPNSDLTGADRMWRVTAKGLVAGVASAAVRGGRGSFGDVIADAVGQGLRDGLGDEWTTTANRAFPRVDSNGDHVHFASRETTTDPTEAEDFLAAMHQMSPVQRLNADDGVLVSSVGYDGLGLRRQSSDGWSYGAQLKPYGQLGMTGEFSPEGLKPFGQSAWSTVYSLGQRFVKGAFYGAVDMVLQPFAQVADLIQATAGFTSGGRYRPSWLSNIATTYAVHPSQATYLRGLIGSNFVTGVGLGAFDVTSKAINGEWGDVAEGIGGLAGTLGFVKGTQRLLSPEPGAQLGVFRVREGIEIPGTVGGIKVLPSLPASHAANFTRAHPEYVAGRPLYRISDGVFDSRAQANANGGYWADRPAPSSEGAWRSTYAVLSAWPNKGRFEAIWRPRPSEAWVWSGKASAQDVSAATFSFAGSKYKYGWIQAGGGKQFWVPDSFNTIDRSALTLRPSPWTK